MEPSETFLRLQPFCIAACKERNVDSLKALTNAIDQIQDDETLQRLQDYVFYPLKLILKLRDQRNASGGGKETGPSKANMPKEKTVELALRCLRAVLKRTTVDSTVTAVQLLTMLFSVLGHPKNGGRVDAGLGEDLKEEVIFAVEALIRNCSDDALEQLCTVRGEAGHGRGK